MSANGDYAFFETTSQLVPQDINEEIPANNRELYFNSSPSVDVYEWRANGVNTNPAGCPPASIIGHAKAITPILPVPLEGPAYFVSHGGEAFPDLEIVLQGYGITIDLTASTFISKTGITSSTFKTVPDQPVTSFELTLPEGPYSALTALGNLCTAKKLVMPTELLAQNGAQIKQSTKIAVTGCPKHKKATPKKKHHHMTKREHKAKR